MIATFQNSVTALANAYNKHILINLDCQACAIGTIVANANNYVVSKGCGQARWVTPDRKAIYASWPKTRTGFHWGKRNRDLNNEQMLYDIGVCEVESTGYTRQQLSMIESAFEGKETMCLSIHRVVEALAIIHNVSPLETEQAKQLFK